MQHQYQGSFGLARLRPLAEQDIEPLRVLRNANKSFFYSDNEITKEQQELWFRQYLVNKSDIMFSVSTQKDSLSLFAGASALYEISGARCEFGRFVIDDSFRGQGLGRDAFIATMEIAFGELMMDEICLSVLEGNHRALDLYESLGFVVVNKKDMNGKQALVLNASSDDYSARRVR